MTQKSRTTGTLIVLAILALVGTFLSMRGGNTPLISSTPTPMSPPPFEQGSPAGAVHAYLEGDFAGERLERASWAKYQKLVLWPSEPKWDTAYVIRSFRVESGKADKKTARVEATFDTIGELDLDTFGYTTSPSRQTVPYTLEMGHNGWILVFPTLKPHVGPEQAIAFLKRMEVGYPTLKAKIEHSLKLIDTDARSSKP